MLKEGLKPRYSFSLIVNTLQLYTQVLGVQLLVGKHCNNYWNIEVMDSNLFNALNHIFQVFFATALKQVHCCNDHFIHP